MSAAEIDNILCVQEIQIHSLHPYIEDFYFQNYLNKAAGKKKIMIFNFLQTQTYFALIIAPHQIPTYSHTPLFDAIGNSSFFREGFG